MTPYIANALLGVCELLTILLVLRLRDMFRGPVWGSVAHLEQLLAAS